MNAAWWLNTAWMLSCAREGAAFRRATRRVAEVQRRLLADTLARNRDTDFGRAHGFGRIRNPREYQRRVPLSRAADYAGAVERIAAGESGVLTRDRVELLEPTSGTTGGEKLIPYTDTLRRQFRRGVAAWIHDLFSHRPALRSGRSYWSVSPALGPRRLTAGGIPIGFDDDTAYLGALQRLAVRSLLVVPTEVAGLGELATFRYCTLLRLLGAADLTLISVWNPTFLTALLVPLDKWQDQLCRDLAEGTLNAPGPVPAGLGQQLARRDGPRAAALRTIFRSPLPLAEKLRQVWPRLGLISCWADAAAHDRLGELRELLPGVEIQPKGLLATEGFVSIPLVNQPAPALAVRSHFFEFQETGNGECRLAHEVEVGGRYRVILTTGGGLYRYQLGDEVEVVGFEGSCPLLHFLGKAERVSDLVGEKLAEPHVRAVLERLFREHKLTPRFALLVPVRTRPARYRLYLQAGGLDLKSSVLSSLRDGLEAGLCENPYYRHAVRFGQLAPAELRPLDPNGTSAASVHEGHCLARGQKVGNIKPAVLDGWTGWPEIFEPKLHHTGQSSQFSELADCLMPTEKR